MRVSVWAYATESVKTPTRCAYREGCESSGSKSARPGAPTGTGGTDLRRRSGLISLNDRVEAVGGTLEIESPPGRGTKIDVEISVP